MPRPDPVQLNIRSAFARNRAADIAKQTGMTVTQVVEDALRAYVPPGQPIDKGRLVRRGPLLVLPAEGAGVVTFAAAEAALEAAREAQIDD
jgi:hypothetical protein